MAVRPLDPVLQAEIAKDVVKPFFAVSIAFPDPVFIWTGTGNIPFADEEWIGIGNADAAIGALDTIGEGVDGSATGVKVTLVGIPSEHREHLEAQAVRGAEFKVYIGALNETRQTVQAYKLLTRAKLDSYQIVDGVDLSVIVTGESRMLDQRRPAIKRYTDAAQQRKYPGDRFFEYMPQLPSIPILWAKAKQDAVL
jgi:hypothetical protein